MVTGAAADVPCLEPDLVAGAAGLDTGCLTSLRTLFALLPVSSGLPDDARPVDAFTGALPAPGSFFADETGSGLAALATFFAGPLATSFTAFLVSGFDFAMTVLLTTLVPALVAAVVADLPAGPALVIFCAAACFAVILGAATFAPPLVVTFAASFDAGLAAVFTGDLVAGFAVDLLAIFVAGLVAILAAVLAVGLATGLGADRVTVLATDLPAGFVGRLVVVMFKADPNFRLAAFFSVALDFI